MGFLEYLNANNAGLLTGVIVGTITDKHIKDVLRELTIEKLYCIDGYEGVGKRSKIKQDDVPEVELSVGDIIDSADSFPDMTFDFIYIDIDHKHFGLYRPDVQAWFKKAKIGGLIGGRIQYVDPRTGRPLIQELDEGSKCLEWTNSYTYDGFATYDDEWWIIRRNNG